MNIDQLREAYAEKGMQFQEYYDKALDVTKDLNGVADRDLVIRGILEVWLTSYANSTPTTKGGKIGRFFARIGAAVVSVVSLNFLKRK